MFSKRICVLLASASVVSFATAAAAQAPTGALDEVVVTAQKRVESVQDVPIAVTVIGSDQLDRLNIRSVSDLSNAAPSFEFVPATNANNGGIPTIRGIGTAANSVTSENSVSVVIDGVPIGRARLDALFDVSRVEVLPGPQGITFGKNASAGVVNITTNAPSTAGYAASLHTDLGDQFDYRVVQGMVNIPLGDKLAFRVSANHNYNSGIYHNVTQNKDSYNQDTGIRARLLFRPNDVLTFNFSGDYATIRNYENVNSFRTAGTGGFVTQITAARPLGCGITPSTENRETCGEAPTFSHIEQFGGAGTMDWAIGDHTLTAIVSYRRSNDSFNQDLDRTTSTNGSIIPTAKGYTAPFNFDLSPFVNEQTQQEIRLTSPTGGRIQYIVGVYHSVTDIFKETYNFPFGALAHNISTADMESYAGFGQATLSVSDNFRLVAGARYTRDSVDATSVDIPLTGPPTIQPPGSSEKYNTSYRLGAELDVSDDVMIYLTNSKGYKGPQVNLPAPPAFPVASVVRAEYPDAWEFGIKSSLFEDNLAFNLSVFRTTVTDFQGQQGIQTPSGPAFALGNIPEVITQGFDLNVFGRVNKNLTINSGLGYTDATYGGGYIVQCSRNPASICDNRVAGTTNIDGVQLASTPHWKANISAEYSQPVGTLEGFVAADVVYRSNLRFSAVVDPATMLDATTILGGRVGLRTEDRRLGASIFVRNATDERVPVGLGFGTTFSAPASTATNQFFAVSSFRLIGISLDARF